MIFGTASLSEVEAVLLTAVIAGILAVWGIITQRIVSRRTATMQHITRVESDRDMIAARQKFIELTKADGGLAKFAADAHRDSEEVKSIRLVLNDFEMMAIGIQFGVLDLEFIKRYWRGTIIRDWTLAAPFVYRLRGELNSPAIYHEFEELTRWLQDNKMPKRSTWTRLWF